MFGNITDIFYLLQAINCNINLKLYTVFISPVGFDIVQ